MSVTQDMEQSFFAVCTSKGYNITKMLGEGSFGKVYLGTRAPKLTASPTDDGRYAIKLALDNDMLHEYLEREIGIQRSLDHPNIIKIYDVFNGKGFKVIVMELMDTSLFNYLLQQPGYCLPESTVRTFTRQIVAGMLCMHKKHITHRDLKPENILMKKNPVNNEWILKIADFGFVKGTDALKTTLGTPDYMAPEIYGGGKYGEKVDLWALGCIVYFMLNGSLWTHGMQTDQIRELVTSSEVIELQDNKVKSFTEASKSFVRSLLIKDPSKRMDFDALEKHPFLSPSVHFTLALNSRPGYPPYLCSGSFDLSSLTTRPLTWGSIANYTYDRVKSWGLVPKDQKMAVVVDNNIVDPGKEFSPKAGLTGTVNIYIFFQHSQPACINKASLTTYSDVTAQEVDNAIGFATGGQAVLNEAFFYKKKIEEMHGYFASFSGMRAEALRFVGELDGVCQSYVDNFLNKLAIEAEAALRRFGVQATLSTIVTGGTEDILKKEGAQDISFMEGLRTDMTIINGILNKTIRCDPSDVKIRSAFYRFRNTHLHAFAEAIRREFDSYINSWNKIAYLILCIPLILKLKGIANTIITDKTREAAAASANSYVTTFTLLICNNPTWKSVPVAELNRSRSASELSTALMTIQDLQAKLEGAYAKIKRLEDENNALQAALKNAEESARLHTPKI